MSHVASIISIGCSFAGHMEKDQEYDGTLESLEERFQKHARQGGVGESGGCTDASVRLSNLLKVTVTQISAWTRMEDIQCPYHPGVL